MTLTPRIEKMVASWKENHFAHSHINHSDGEFFAAVGINPDTVGTTSFSGSDLVYYDTKKVRPGTGSMVPIITTSNENSN